VWQSTGKNVSTEAEDIVGILHQATSSEDKIQKITARFSESSSVCMSESVIVTCKCPVSPIHVYSHL
jgi:hypothetical protein